MPTKTWWQRATGTLAYILAGTCFWYDDKSYVFIHHFILYKLFQRTFALMHRKEIVIHLWIYKFGVPGGCATTRLILVKFYVLVLKIIKITLASIVFQSWFKQNFDSFYWWHILSFVPKKSIHKWYNQASWNNWFEIYSNKSPHDIKLFYIIYCISYFIVYYLFIYCGHIILNLSH